MSLSGHSPPGELESEPADARPPRRGRPPKAEGGSAGDTAILDAAEALFAEHGFDGVTLRQVSKRAGVDTALVHYYFSSKRGLFDAVFLRRAAILNEERLRALDAYERAQGARMTVRGLMEAFLRPVLDPSTHTGPGWRSYFALVAQVNNTPVWGGETMTRYFDPVIHRLIDLLRRVLPEAPEAELYWAYHMVSGALTLTMGQTGRLDLLSGGLCASSDLSTAADRMVAFATAGFEALRPGTSTSA
ncbi:MAG: TetR family transcriptional regulator [Proteobacteria bacterium]|nr:TetR family transcriptional regulator [Pseudomonadota bacterium]